MGERQSEEEEKRLHKETPNLSLEQLPKVTVWDKIDLYQWNGYWYKANHLKAAMACRELFQARHDDVIIASSMKTGSTWLKALCFSILQAHNYDDPLAKNHPSFYVTTLEVRLFASNPLPDISTMKSPRIFHTHMPYSHLPDSIKNSHCKIVYITRNPKDTLLSMWHFFNKIWKPEQGQLHPLEELYKNFCNGVSHFGPFFDHVLEYWNESLKLKDQILFLKYEDLNKNPREELKRLASFIGKEITNDEEIDEILWKCSLDRLKSFEVNKNGVDPLLKIPYSAYFRNGFVGDWKNGLTSEMAEKIDEITCMKLEGTGLEFGK